MNLRVQGSVARDLCVGSDSFSAQIRRQIDNADEIRAEAIKSQAKSKAEKVVAAAARPDDEAESAKSTISSAKSEL